MTLDRRSTPRAPRPASGPARRPRPPKQRTRPTTASRTSRVRRASHPAGVAVRRPIAHYRSLSMVWLLVFALMVVQVVRLQVTKSPELVAASERQRIAKITLLPERGDLVDRYGVPMAISVREWTLVADPTAVTDIRRTTDTLTETFGFDAAAIEARLNRPGRYVILAKGLDEEKANRFRKLRLDGLYLQETPNRVYPAGDLSRSVLGRVNRSEGFGETGLEKMLQDQLAGKPGELLVERNARGQRIPAGLNRLEPAKRGTTFVLTLDRALEYAVDGMLAQSIANTGAKSGIVAVADVKSGDVLALSNMRVDSDGYVLPSEHNAALVSVYEPGSVNKVITIAAALEQGVISPTSRFSVPDRMQVADHNFKDDEPHREAMYSPGDILTASSNIGTIKIAQALGRKQVDRYLRSFGLGQKTGINFPGESPGILLPVKKWTGTSIGTVPIGQGLAVTALQMLGVYTTLANDGNRLPLRLIRGTIDNVGKEQTLPLADPTRVISSQTARQVTDMLESVVRRGTGRNAQVDGYRVAGKTGTAQKPNLRSRGYQKDAYVASFAGYFPAEKPRLAIIVILDEPKTSIYGGTVAAPLFAEIAHFAGQHYRIAPSEGNDTTRVRPTAEPPVNGVVAATREMRAVQQTGTWQAATIRRAALRPGTRAVVAPSLQDAAPAKSSNSGASAASSVAVDTGVAAATPKTGTKVSDVPNLSSHARTSRGKQPTAAPKTVTRETDAPAATIAPPAERSRPAASSTGSGTATPAASGASVPDLSDWTRKNAPKPRAVSRRPAPVEPSSAEAGPTRAAAEVPQTAASAGSDRTAVASEATTEVAQ